MLKIMCQLMQIWLINTRKLQLDGGACNMKRPDLSTKHLLMHYSEEERESECVLR